MDRALDLMRTGVRQSAPVRYGATIGLVILSILARLGLEPLLTGARFLLAYPVVFGVSLLFGRYPGVLAITAYVVSTAFFLMPPRYSLRVEDPGEVLALVIFAAASVVMVWLADVMHAALARAAAAEREKNLLLREAHHRIRNDLQSVAAILHLAKARPDNHAAWIDAALARINVLNRVYARLRNDSAVPLVDAREFIETLVEDLRSATAGLRPIAVYASAESVPLNAGCAVSLGIVINELLTNAFKYAFPDDRSGSVEVTFQRDGSDFVLRVSDDGVGLSSSEPKGTGLGAKLVRQVAMQLRGRLDVTNKDGVTAVLRFPASLGLNGAPTKQASGGGGLASDGPAAPITGSPSIRTQEP